MKDYVHLNQEVYDTAFSIKDTAKYRLSIKVSLNGFSFLGRDDKRFVFLVDYSLSGIRDGQHLCFALDYILDKQHLLTKAYGQIDIIFDTGRNTLLPQLFYDEERKEGVAKISYNFSQQELIFVDFLKSSFVNLYPIPKEFVDFVAINFSSARIFSKAKVLIDCMMLKSIHAQYEKVVYLNVDRQSINIIVFEKGSLLFFNSFSYKFAKDIVYYLLYVYDQLKLSSSIVPLRIIGKLRKGDAVYQLLYAYIKDIAWVENDFGFQYSNLFEKNARGDFYELIHHSLCE